MPRLRHRPRSRTPIPDMPPLEKCPGCETRLPSDDFYAQKAHMEKSHPEIIEQRLTSNGFTRLTEGTIHDDWSSD